MKRAVAFGALWTASAAAAVGLGLLAVSLVDAGASPGTAPAAATAGSTAPSTTPPGDTTTPAPVPPAPAPTSGEYSTVGGTIVASCDGDVLQVAAAPATGWWLDDQDERGEVEFESEDGKVEVHVTCVDGTPSFSDVDIRTGEDGAGRSSGSSSASTGPSAPDDSDGRRGGGHGSDDGPGDDSSGRGRGGSGSDD
ncbi:hypothetical protein GCU56_06530 [Geodermatophilus sabuli]|uniref:Septum formation initiator n=1 Tax=Geodermatophilus sabuli TaxID=1564158 RepID=A0A7K3VY13_9ACTN|nr:hypothetical protein [Geodermatophilus sabuli]NEK57526.1 hypothetical protein [Geodermatophilus sabuli]